MEHSLENPYTGKKILLVEDDEAIRSPTVAFLQRAGYVVTGAVTSGEEAVRLAQSDPPDLILMDVMLDGPMTGIQAAEQISRVVRVPIIFVTGQADKIQVLQGDGKEPVTKPFRPEDLKSAINLAFYRASLLG